MRRSEKAALWSALVFPGVGHLLLRLYRRGLVLMALTAGAIYYIVNDLLARGLVDKTNALVDRILSGEVAPDLGSTASLIDLGPDPVSVEIVSWLIVACWLYGIVDSYREGARQDKALRSTPGDAAGKA